MNALIQEIAQQGRSQEVYGTICTAAAVISFCYSLWHGRKLGVPLWKQAILVLAVYFGMSYMQGVIWKLVLHIRNEQIFGIKTAVNSIVRVFWFVPLIGFVFAKILRLKTKLAWDAIAMFPLLQSGIAQLACLFSGCCMGHPWKWGVFSVQTYTHCVPVPILETVLSLAIFVNLLLRIRKSGYQSDGRYLPRMLMLYGAMRFVCEALRNNEKVLPLCSAVGIHALLLCAFGIAWLFVDKIIQNRKSEK